ncbi:hypothetical protein ACIBCR_15105 [Micromonospora echinospora]|uniref:hypothetical protein n=1 Tax=Micromonospora echinospora TaxID=1877 RepID=UPI00379EABEA
MRPSPQYIAQQAIAHNGVRAYNPGDDVPESAVNNLGLTIGVEVLPAHADVIPRPAGNAKRAQWEAYWLGQGMPQADIDEMTRDELAAREPEVIQPPEVAQAQPVTAAPNPAPDVIAEQATDQTVGQPVERPGQNARKSDWVNYAVYRGMPRETAEESTIPQLADTDYDTLFGPEPPQ